MLRDSKLVGVLCLYKEILSISKKAKLMKEGNQTNALIIWPCHSLFLKCCTEKREPYRLKCRLIESEATSNLKVS